MLGDKSTLPEIVSAKYKSAHQVRTNSVCEFPQSRVVQLVPRKCQSDIQDDLPSLCDGCCLAFYCPRRRLRPRGRVLNTVDSTVNKYGIGGKGTEFEEKKNCSNWHFDILAQSKTYWFFQISKGSLRYHFITVTVTIAKSFKSLNVLKII